MIHIYGNVSYHLGDRSYSLRAHGLPEGSTAEVKLAGDDGVRGLRVGVERLVVEDAAHGAVGIAGLSRQCARVEVGVKVWMEKPEGDKRVGICGWS